jgi:hypothetical protein
MDLGEPLELEEIDPWFTVPDEMPEWAPQEPAPVEEPVST